MRSWNTVRAVKRTPSSKRTAPRLRPVFALSLLILMFISTSFSASPPDREEIIQIIEEFNFDALRSAIEDLKETFGERYASAESYLARLESLEVRTDEILSKKHSKEQTSYDELNAHVTELRSLKYEALVANPLLEFDELLVVKRKRGKPTDMKTLGFPSNHECNSSLKKDGYENEIAILSPIRRSGEMKTFYKSKGGGYVGEIDLHWDAERLLFAQSDEESWKVWEIRTDGTNLHQVSQMLEDVDSFDACYTPDGRIVFGSTASYQSVPCWHGQRHVTNLYLMDADGSNVRQLCFDQDHNFHPSIMNNGQILFHRWDYTGINHIFMRQLMVMNPDGTGQRALYGSNSWYPNSLYFPREIPGAPGKIICILSGYHGVHRAGQLVLVNVQKGWYGANGISKRISGKGDPIKPMVRDQLVDDDWPRFLHPYPLSEKYFLVSCQPTAKSEWGIYLADIFDNVVLLRKEPGYALLEPVPLRNTKKPPAIPDRVNLKRKDAVVYLQNMYVGPGLEGVPKDTIKNLRVFAYHYGYRQLAGPDKIGYGGPWEVMRILGTVPIEEDGSAIFRIPANTPVAVQALDDEGKAVQLMRSWFTAMPGEVLSCVGCHESPADVPPAQQTAASLRQPRDIQPWYGPARGFDFAREVQPVLNRYCISCHNGTDKNRPDLRPEFEVPDYKGKKIAWLGVQRLHPQMLEDTKGFMRYTPAYDSLIPYLRRVGIEDDVSLLIPGEYHTDTSELIQMLAKGHHGVCLDKEAWDRLITWIDLNAPCHGTWGEVYPIPEKAHERRMALRKLYGGPEADPEVVPELPEYTDTPVKPKAIPRCEPVNTDGWPLDTKTARRRQASAGEVERSIDLGDGVVIQLTKIPAGEFVMGDPRGEPDECPLSRVTLKEPFWIGTCEITNEQFRMYDPTHTSKYYAKRHARQDDKGLTLNEPNQPAVRVSWTEAMAFCEWLSDRTGLTFTLPTEAQWEYACRAGTDTDLSYGGVKDDFSEKGNMGDTSFSVGLIKDGEQITGGLHHLVLEGAELSDARYNDASIVTASVGNYQPNAWGLFDTHGNAAEWTRSRYRPYPYDGGDGRNSLNAEGERVVRGGSWFDRPERCRSAFRLSYPSWQKVFNVGFRVVCLDQTD